MGYAKREKVEEPSETDNCWRYSKLTIGGEPSNYNVGNSN